MVHGLKRSNAQKILGSLLWTAALSAILFALDRRWLGPPRPDENTWLEAATLEFIPGARNDVVTPPYLPSELTWPPKRVIHRAGEPHDWWLGLSGSRSRDVRLWIGIGNRAPPEALGNAAACTDELATSCPDGWHGLSGMLRDGRSIRVAGDIDPDELERVLDALARARGVL